MAENNESSLESLHRLRNTERNELAKSKSDALAESRLLKEFVAFFESGGERGSVHTGMPPDHYLSKRAADLVTRLQGYRQSIEHLTEQIERKEGKL
jgi:hypothetical protein